MGNNSIPRNSFCCGRSLPDKSPRTFWGWPQARGEVSVHTAGVFLFNVLAPGARGGFRCIETLERAA